MYFQLEKNIEKNAKAFVNKVKEQMDTGMSFDVAVSVVCAAYQNGEVPGYDMMWTDETAAELTARARAEIGQEPTLER